MPRKEYRRPFNKSKKKLTIPQKVAVAAIVICAYSVPTLFGRQGNLLFFIFVAALFSAGVILDLFTEEDSKLSSLKEVLWRSLTIGTVAFFILLIGYYLFVLLGAIGR